MAKPFNPAPPTGLVFDIGTGQAADSHDGAAGKAIDWLTDRHRKGWGQAVRDWLDRVAPSELFELGLPEQDEDLRESLVLNSGEWLLARGEIFAKGQLRNINAYLLGRDGPWFSPAQQRWIAQMAERELRLWRVTEVRRGQGLTLVDALDMDAPPVTVQERSGSQSAEVGMLIGARVMQLADHCELSGATYSFARLCEAEVLQAVAAAADPALPPAQARELAETTLARHWLKQWFTPTPMPQIIDASTGEPMLLVTDHYQVLDAAALAQVLAAQPDVEGDATTGWTRFEPLDGNPDSDPDGARRSLLAINPGRNADRIELFARTQSLADGGRAWFDKLAGASVRHVTRELTDPRSSSARAGAGDQRSSFAGLPNIAPEDMTRLFEQVMRRTYSKWADEPVPLLGNLTPRQAIGTPGGLERVRGLLREYEAGEARMAAGDGRAAVSLQFLWDSIGISR